MSSGTDFVTSEREAITQYADWYLQQGYQVSVHPSPRELPEFLRTLAPDLVARRNGENIVVEIKTSSPASFEQVQQLARVLENRAGWKLQVVYADLADPEWTPPPELPEIQELSELLASAGAVDENDDRSPLQFLLLWSIIEGAARHHLSSRQDPPDAPDFLIGSAEDTADRRHHRRRSLRSASPRLGGSQCPRARLSPPNGRSRVVRGPSQYGRAVVKVGFSKMIAGLLATAATSAASGGSPRRSNTASSA